MSAASVRDRLVREGERAFGHDERCEQSLQVDAGSRGGFVVWEESAGHVRAGLPARGALASNCGSGTRGSPPHDEQLGNHNKEMEAMTVSGGIEDAHYGGPAVYRIVVQGALAEHWSDRMASMKITSRSSGAGTKLTILEGRIQDQAQLTGVLNTLYGLHLSIVRVETINDESSPTEPQRSPGAGPEGRNGEGS